jgi:hypothetical protein
LLNVVFRRPYNMYIPPARKGARMLTQEPIDHFETFGFLLLRQVFSTLLGDRVVCNHSTKHSAWGGGQRRQLMDHIPATDRGVEERK